MKLLFQIDLFSIPFDGVEGRKSYIVSGYRPDWIINNEYHCGIIIFEKDQILVPGKAGMVLLEPLVPELWESVKITDNIYAYEGTRKVLSGIVQKIYKL